MLISWLGQCCFLLQDSLGRRILTDPLDLYDIDNILSLNPKLITLSHCHLDTPIRNYKNSKLAIINKDTINHLDFCDISGYLTYHDKNLGIKRGVNYIYKFKFDNLTLCHLGHIGHIPSEEIMSSLRDIDILFIPVGGHFTINGLEASMLVNIIKPKIVIPMYYKNNSNSLEYLDSPQSFITSMKYVIKLNKLTLDTNELEFDQSSQTILMRENTIKYITKKTV